MNLLKNKFRLLGFVFTFLFILVLLIGFLYGRKPIKGATRYSDNYFYTSEVSLKKNVLYKFDCDFDDKGLFINDVNYTHYIFYHFSIICDKNCILKFRHDEHLYNFSFFWKHDFVVYENQIDDMGITFYRDTLQFYYVKSDYEKVIRHNFGYHKIFNK